MALGLGALGVASPGWDRYLRQRKAGSPPLFFTEKELATLGVLADMIIPRDERSGSATDSGALEYMDFVASESNDQAKAGMRAELAWYDAECGRRFGTTFTGATEAERAQLLDDIAWPARASEAMKPHAEFFNRIRDLTAAAFFSSRMGVMDLRYMGNVYNPDWQGAPPKALEELGVTYEEWDRKYGGQQ